MLRQPFDRSEHVYHNEELVELIKDAVRFFNGTPVHPLPLQERFLGTGVYALYYTGKSEIYQRYGELNRLEYKYPIYVGKAVPEGWRQSRTSHDVESRSAKLYSRIREHTNSINKVAGIDVHDFSCRFVIFEGTGSDMIGTIEAAIIKLSRSLWNSTLDGFGNHTPGAGRFNQAKSDWDVVHPGREFADKCTGIPRERADILAKIAAHLSTVGDQL